MLEAPDAVICFIAARRLERVPPGALAANHADGRLMLYEPATNLRDGAAAAESGGYLDADNAPPWDTWVAWLPPTRAEREPGALLAWVPAVFVSAVEQGIAINPEECIRWAPPALALAGRCQR